MAHPQVMEMDIAWGGYYATKKDDGGYSAFRLLDINNDAIHYALYNQKFDNEPTFEELKKLKPFIGHAPIATGSLFNESEPKLVGAEPLTSEDLEGYLYYLENMGMPDDARKDFEKELIDFSHQPPVKAKLTQDGDEVKIKPAGEEDKK